MGLALFSCVPHAGEFVVTEDILQDKDTAVDVLHVSALCVLSDCLRVKSRHTIALLGILTLNAGWQDGRYGDNRHRSSDADSSAAPRK
eukprot:2218456-Rhodomonas_salina.1